MTDKEAIDVTNQMLDQSIGLGFFKSRQMLQLIEQAFAHLHQAVQDRQDLQAQVKYLQDQLPTTKLTT